MEETGLVLPGIQDPFGPPGSLGSLASCSLGSLEHNNAAQQYINLPPGKLWESTSAQCSPVLTTSPIGTWPQGTRRSSLKQSTRSLRSWAQQPHSFLEREPSP